MALLKPDPMSDTDEIREYRFSFRGRFNTAGIGLLVLLALRVVLLALRGFDLADAIILAVFVGPALAAVLWSVLLSGTRTTPEALITRGFGPARVTPWAQVSAIGIEPWRGRQNQFTPKQAAVFYDGSGTRRLLPNLTDRGRLDLVHEVTLLRGIWQRHRGPAWAPTPPATPPARRGHPRLKALGVALAVALLDFVLLVVAVSTLPDPFDGKDPGLAVDILVPLLVILGPAAVAFAITLRIARPDRPMPRTKKQARPR